MSVNKVEMKTIKKMPAFLGEVDVIRSIQFLPGVSSVGEGSSGFNVRGGGIDQNLVLLDEVLFIILLTCLDFSPYLTLMW